MGVAINNSVLSLIVSTMRKSKTNQTVAVEKATKRSRKTSSGKATTGFLSLLESVKAPAVKTIHDLIFSVVDLSRHSTLGLTIAFRLVSFTKDNKANCIAKLDEIVSEKFTTPRDAGKPCDLFLGKGGKRINKLGGYKVGKDVAIFQLHNNGCVSYKEGKINPVTCYLPPKFVTTNFDVKVRG